MKYWQINVKKTFVAGTILVALVPLLLVLLPVTGIVTVLLMGAFNGLGVGAYWVNRNYLTVEATTDADRNHFFGISQAIFISASVVVPALAGAFLAGLELLGAGEALRFGLLMMIGLLFAGASAAILRDNKFDSPEISRVSLFDFSLEWSLAKTLSFFNSMKFGIMLFLPTVVIFEIVGGKAELGGVITFVSLIAVVLSYLAGRIIPASRRFWLMFWGVVTFTIGAIAFGISYSLLGISILLVMNRISSSFRFGGISGIWYKIIDKHPPNMRFAYLCDNEVWINLGRAVGLVIFILILRSDIPLELAAGMMMAVLAVAEIITLAIARYITWKY